MLINRRMEGIMLEKLTALLPMKGHSERIPNKNTNDFCGRKLYHRIMESLLASQYIKSVVVNTDSSLIAEDVLKHFNRVEIINRPENLRDDLVPMNDVIAHDLSQLEGGYFLQTHCTNPLLTTQTIEEAIRRYFDNLEKYDSLFSVTKLQERLYTKEGDPLNHRAGELLRTQDMPPIFLENSNLYIFSKASFEASGGNRVGSKPLMFEINKLEAIDIDEPEDWMIAESLYAHRIEMPKERG
ncbi:cytidylyltransferase domain-containing protein [Candidatus Omnitrophota bacterium]